MLEQFDGFDLDEASLGASSLTNQALSGTQAMMGAMFDALPIALLIHSNQGVLLANRAAASLLDTSEGDLVGQHFLDFIASEDGDVIWDAFNRSFSETTPVQRETTLQRPDGSHRLVSVICGRLPWPGIPVTQILFRDITDQKRAEASLRQLTITDELTGAYNRRHAFYEASLYFNDAKADVPLSVALIDIDHFKRINDTFGHAAGDAALKGLTGLANGLLPTFREANSALFARFGGEEFMLILPGLELQRAGVIANRFRHAVERTSFPWGDAAIRFTVSVGLAQASAADGSLDSLIARADKALYSAKEWGRNRVVSVSAPGA